MSKITKDQLKSELIQVTRNNPEGIDFSQIEDSELNEFLKFINKGNSVEDLVNLCFTGDPFSFFSIR